MNIFPTSTLSEPSGADRIPLGTLGYFRARNKHRMYSLVLNEFKKSGLSQADLARRLGKKPDVVCRLLGGPGNWTLDTVSDVLFAINGAELTYSVSHPLRKKMRNYRAPEWIANSNLIRVASERSTANTTPPASSLLSLSPVPASLPIAYFDLGDQLARAPKQ